MLTLTPQQMLYDPRKYHFVVSAVKLGRRLSLGIGGVLDHVGQVKIMS
jgi:hypothetical protein